MTRVVQIVSGIRADFGIYRPVIREMMLSKMIDPQLLICGAHLDDRFGRTIDPIEAEGWPVAAKLETMSQIDSPVGICQSMARGTERFGEWFASSRPDILLLLGDRYEMLAAASAAMIHGLPIAHIHGGETTEGLIDEAIRHSITKMSHFHFASTEAYARRIIQLGEHPSTVFVTGAPGLDALNHIEFLTRESLEQRLEIALDDAPLIATFHPVTLEYEQTQQQIRVFLKALEGLNRPIIITFPNADTMYSQVIEEIRYFSEKNANVRTVSALGTEGYFSLMSIAAAMVGNSSSGIIEAGSFGLPVVNVGNRQRGRLSGRNVLDCAAETKAIREALERVLDPKFKAALNGMKNIYGDGTASKRIVDALSTVDIGPSCLQKSFYDLPVVQQTNGERIV